MMMEEGSFQPQITHDFVEENQPLEITPTQAPLDPEDVSRVPIPTQLPVKPDLSALPEQIQRSGAVEALIQQNEDLMARLSVAIRRSALVEDKMGKYESAIQQLKDRNEVLADQVLVHREKDRLQGNSRKKYEKQIREYRENIALLEVQYAEYFATSKERQRSLSSNMDQLSRRLGRHLRYRARIQRISRQMRKDLQGQVHQLSGENQRLVGRLQQEEIRLHEVREKLSETIDHIQRQAQESETNQRQLVENYENQFSDLKIQLKQNQDHIVELEVRVEDYEKLYEEKVSLQNKLVAVQRSAEEKEEEFNSEVRRLQVDLANFRREAKEKTLELDRLTQASIQEISDLEELRQAKTRLEDQVESLQCLWRDTNNQLELQSEKNKALQKLNQQLSTSLNERRKEVENLRGQMDSHGFRASDKIRDLQGQVKALGETNIKLQEENESTRSDEISSRREAIDRIQSLMAEIQSGFSIKEEGSESTDSTDEPPPL